MSSNKSTKVFSSWFRKKNKTAKKQNSVSHVLHDPEKNEVFAIFGLGCSRNKEKYVTIPRDVKSSFRLNYYPIHRKCYEERSSAVLSILDRHFNPFNFPLRNFSEEIRDTKSFHASESSEKIDSMRKSKEINKETESLTKKVLRRLNKNKKGGNHNVFIFGHSFGGMIVNRLCEELQKLADRDEQLKVIIKEHLCVLALNSIFITHKNNVKDINIVNMMNFGDVAIRLNRLETWFDRPHRDIMNNTGSIQTDLQIKYYHDKNTDILWYGEIDETGEVISTDTKFSMIGNTDEWKRHNTKTLPILYKFLHYGTNKIKNWE